MLDRVRQGLAAALTHGSDQGRLLSRAEVSALRATAGAVPASFELGALVADTLARGVVTREAAAPWIDLTQSGANPWRTRGLSDAEYEARLAGPGSALADVPWPAGGVTAGSSAGPRWSGAPLTLGRALALSLERLARAHTLEPADVRAALRALPAPAGAHLARRAGDTLLAERCLLLGWQTLVREALVPDGDATRARALIDDLLASSLPPHLVRRLARDYRALTADAPALHALWPAAREPAGPVPAALLEEPTARYFAPWLAARAVEHQAVTEFLGHAWTRHTHLEVGRATERLGRKASRVGTFLSVEHFLRALGPVWTEFAARYATPERLARATFRVSFVLPDIGFTTGWSTDAAGHAQLHRGVTVVIEKRAPSGLIGLTTCYPTGAGAAFALDAG